MKCNCRDRGEKMVQAIEEHVNLDETTTLVKELYEVITPDRARLILTRKRPVEPSPDKTPVLMLHGLGQNRYSFDLTRRSMANFFVKNGYDVYIAELRGHGLSRANGSPYPKTFEEYVNLDVPVLIEFVRKISECPKVFILGHSLGGTICYCLSSLTHHHIRGMIPIAGPSHFGRGVPLVKACARIIRIFQKYTLAGFFVPDIFKVDLIGKVALNTRVVHVFDHSANRFFHHLWFPGSIERPLLLERIQKGFDRTGTSILSIMVKWAKTGRFLSSGKKKDYEQMLQRIRIPILFVTADKDTIVPASSVELAYEAVSSKDKTWRIFGEKEDGMHFGHLDLICGKEAPARVWPYILNWIREREPVQKTEKSGTKRFGALNMFF